MSESAKPKVIKITFNGETAITVTAGKHGQLPSPTVQLESALSDADAKVALALALAVLADSMYDTEIMIDVVGSVIFVAANPN